MFPAETFRNTLGRLAAILTGRGIRFHLTGGVTSIAYGEPRMTQDVDMVVDPVPLEAGLAGFLAAVEAAGFLVEPESVRRAVRDRGMFQLFDLAESLKVDLYPRELIPGDRGAVGGHAGPRTACRLSPVVRTGRSPALLQARGQTMPDHPQDLGREG